MGHHVLDVAQAQREAVVEPHAVTDDLHWEPVTLVQRRWGGVHEGTMVPPHGQTEHPSPANLTMSMVGAETLGPLRPQGQRHDAG